MSFWLLLLVFSFAFPYGHGEGFFSKLINHGKSETNQPNNYVDICETIRIMPRIALAVVGGAPLKVETSAPYIAAIGEKTSNSSVSWFCGGSLISPNLILTAAHCLVSRNVTTVRLGSFSAKTRSTQNDYDVIDTTIHPGYKITESYNDIGTVKLKERVNFDTNIKPVCLPQDDNEKYEKERAKVIGWGAEEFGGEGTQKLQQVEVEVFTNANCDKAYSNSTISPKTFPKGIKSEQLCAGSKKGGKDACQGDSGGPLVLTDREGIVRQIGIVSTGAGCGFKMYPGVYTRVSSYRNWIQQQIKKADSSKSSPKDYSSKETSGGGNKRPSTTNSKESQGVLLNVNPIRPSTANSKESQGVHLNVNPIRPSTANSKESQGVHLNVNPIRPSTANSKESQGVHLNVNPIRPSTANSKESQGVHLNVNPIRPSTANSKESQGVHLNVNPLKPSTTNSKAPQGVLLNVNPIRPSTTNSKESQGVNPDVNPLSGNDGKVHFEKPGQNKAKNNSDKKIVQNSRETHRGNELPPSGKSGKLKAMSSGNSVPISASNERKPIHESRELSSRERGSRGKN